MIKNSELAKLKSLSINQKDENVLNNKLNIRKLHLNHIDSHYKNNNYENIYLPVPQKRRKYIFGDFVQFAEKYNRLHRFILLKKGIQSSVNKFDVEIRRKYKTLKKNNVQSFNFTKYIKNIFDDVNFNFNYYERKYQTKLNAHKFCMTTRKYILLTSINKIKLFIHLKYNLAIKIQSKFRSFIFQKKFVIWKSDLITKAIVIQKYVRRFLIKKKYKVNLVSIIDFVKYNQKVKLYKINLKIMLEKRKAIRIIENWWEGILEERRKKELEEQIKKMPQDCQKLYRQFIKLGKQTRIVKKNMKEFIQKKIGFVP